MKKQIIISLMGCFLSVGALCAMEIKDDAEALREAAESGNVEEILPLLAMDQVDVDDAPVAGLIKDDAEALREAVESGAVEEILPLLAMDQVEVDDAPVAGLIDANGADKEAGNKFAERTAFEFPVMEMTAESALIWRNIIEKWDLEDHPEAAALLEEKIRPNDSEESIEVRIERVFARLGLESCLEKDGRN